MTVVAGVLGPVRAGGDRAAGELPAGEQLSRLRLGLQFDGAVDRGEVARLGPMLQGVLMESIDTDYAEMLHSSPVNPYSQFVVAPAASAVEWHIATLTSEAVERLAKPLLREEFSEFVVRGLGRSATVSGRSLELLPLSEVVQTFYAAPPARRFRVEFVTPTGFKQSGEYVFQPDPRLVFQSLAQKYCAVVDGEEPEEGLVEEFGRSIRLTAFRVASQQFAIGAARVPGFVGSATFTVRGADSFASYVAALLRFGEFSGCGIKTSMGMGAIRATALPRARNQLVA